MNGRNIALEILSFVVGLVLIINFGNFFPNPPTVGFGLLLVMVFEFACLFLFFGSITFIIADLPQQARDKLMWVIIVILALAALLFLGIL